MLIASLLAGVALAASDGDPDGVVTTAPTNAPTLAQALAAAPEASLTAPTAQDAAPHGMTTEQQIQNWISTRTAGATFDESAEPGAPAERKMHGMVEAGIGTGGYKVTNFAPGEVLELVRHENYFKPNAAFVDSVELLAINDPSALSAAFQSGQVNLTSGLDARTAGLLETMPNLRIFKMEGGGYISFNMRCDTAPFDNPDMRLALKLAVDREDMLQRVGAGVGSVGNDTPVPSNDAVFSSNVPQKSYDPERARALFESVGYTGTIVLHTSDAISSKAIDMATVFQEHAARAGIPIEVQRDPADGYWSSVVGVAPFHVSARSARPTADAIFSTAFLSTSENNECKWVNEEFDAAIIAARAEGNLERRLALYERAQEICSVDGGTMIPFFSATVQGTSADVDGFNVGAVELNGYRAVEQVWFT